MAESLFSEQFLQRLERMSLAARRMIPGITQGERRSTKRGQSVEFTDFRPYSTGDDFRRIDWNAYARLERFFIKLFVEEEDLTVHLMIDQSRSMDWGEPNKLQYAIRVAGALGYISLAGLDRVTVMPINGYRQINPLHSLRGKRQAFTLFSYLQTLASSPTGMNFDPAIQLRAYVGIHKNPGILILISDLMHDGWIEGLRSLVSNGFDISVIHILSPDEKQPIMTGDLKLIDIEDNTEIEITADYDLLTKYQQNVTEWQDNINRFCQSRNINYVPVETSLPLEDLLFSWLQRKKVIR